MLGIFYLLGSLFGLTSGAVREGYDKEMGKAAWKKNPTDDGLYWGRGGKQYDIMTGREAFIEVDSHTGHRWVVDAKKSTRIRDVDSVLRYKMNEKLYEAGATAAPNYLSSKAPDHIYFEDRTDKNKIRGKRYFGPYPDGKAYVIRVINNRNYYFDLEAGLLYRTTDGQKLADVKFNIEYGHNDEYRERDEKVVREWNERLLTDPYAKKTMPGWWNAMADFKEDRVRPEDYELIRRWK